MNCSASPGGEGLPLSDEPHTLSLVTIWGGGCQAGGEDVGPPTTLNCKDCSETEPREPSRHVPSQGSCSQKGAIDAAPNLWAATTHLEEGDDAISGDSLQQARCPRQALQAGAAGGEEGADDDDPGGRPGQHANDQVPLQGLPEPARGAGGVDFQNMS